MKPNSIQFKVDGEEHVVDKHGNKYKVHHPGKKNKTYTLDANSLSEAKNAVKEWHKKNG
jgi:hypothetical protein